MRAGAPAVVMVLEETENGGWLLRLLEKGDLRALASRAASLLSGLVSVLGSTVQLRDCGQAESGVSLPCCHCFLRTCLQAPMSRHRGPHTHAPPVALWVWSGGPEAPEELRDLQVTGKAVCHAHLSGVPRARGSAPSPTSPRPPSCSPMGTCPGLHGARLSSHVLPKMTCLDV